MSLALTDSGGHTSNRSAVPLKVLHGQTKTSYTGIGTLVTTDKDQGLQPSGTSIFFFPGGTTTLKLRGLAAVEQFGHLHKLEWPVDSVHEFSSELPHLVPCRAAHPARECQLADCHLWRDGQLELSP